MERCFLWDLGAECFPDDHDLDTEKELEEEHRNRTFGCGFYVLAS